VNLAQGLLGGAETLVAGITATVIGQIYQHLGYKRQRIDRHIQMVEWEYGCGNFRDY
jgi:hypothetical protein